MLAQLAAKLAAVCAAGGARSTMKYMRFVALAATSVTLEGCMAPPAQIAGQDPADPGARVAAVSYRSTVAPYQSLRPVAPSSWRERNNRVAPVSNSGR